jgi:hypothetical protein
MIKNLVFVFLALLCAPALAAPVAPKVIVTINLTTSTFHVRKASRFGTQELDGKIIPVAPGSVHTGTFRPTVTYQRYWTDKGSVILTNVVKFGRNGSIRSSRMFNEWLASRRPATGAIVLNADVGGLLYHTIKTYGVSRTVIHITY